jgi:predicted nucleic acid-binding protein
LIYFDTSAVVKLYLDEPHSEYVQSHVSDSFLFVTSQLTYTETISAFSKANRMSRLSDSDLERVTRAFESDWSSYFLLSVTDEIVTGAAEFARNYELRAYDAIHLASASTHRADQTDDVSFISFDDSLHHSAERESLDALRPSS